MTTATRDYKTMQLWPSGRSVAVAEEGGQLLVRFEGDADFRPATDAERRLVRIEQSAERLADREVWHVDSYLVDALLKLGFEHNDEFFREWSLDADNVKNLVADPSEWGIERCRDWLEENGYEDDYPDPDPWAMDADGVVALLTEAGEFDTEDDGSRTDAELRERLLDAIDSDFVDGLEAWRDAVRERAGDHEAEVYEWWRVSEWLGKRLAENGDVVLDNAFGCWWGRTCTGQGYLMDGTLQEVAAALYDKYGH